MDRRSLVKGAAAVTAAAAASVMDHSAAAQVTTAAQTTTAAQAVAGSREYYLIRRYKLNSGPQAAGAGKYFQGALLPALGRTGLGPVGVMGLTYGSETPTTYVIVPSTDVAKLVQLDLMLAKDEAFLKAAAPFWSAAATAPPFDRVSSSLSIAFEGYPKLTAPANVPRILQLRTYESPTHAAHERKVEMFHAGEFGFFAESGAGNVFFAQDLVGTRGPSLTYMLAHKNLEEMDAHWKAFAAVPGWQKLSHDPKYASEPIVSTVSNLVLTPAAYSQI